MFTCAMCNRRIDELSDETHDWVNCKGEMFCNACACKALTLLAYVTGPMGIAGELIIDRKSVMVTDYHKLKKIAGCE